MSRQTGPFHDRASAVSGHMLSDLQNGPVSLANIATAFLSERKSSSRRQNSLRRKTRLAAKGKQSSSSSGRHSSYSATADEKLDSGVARERVDGGIATLFTTTNAITNDGNKHPSKMLSQEDHRLLLSSSEWVEDIKDSDPYVSVISRLGEAIQDSETYLEFVKKSFGIVTNTIVATAVFILLTVFQVILFFMGVKYLNDCPRQPNLPVYLLVVGSMGLVRVLNLLWRQFRRRRMRKLEGFELDQEEETENNGSSFTDAVLNLFLLAWFIVGQIWTWQIFPPKYEFGLENPDNYCHRNLYIFTLVHIGLVYVMFLVTILFLIALTCCARFPHLIIKTPR